MQGISIVTAAYNEESNIKKLVPMIKNVMKTRLPNVPYEIIVVDDGSIDKTYEAAKAARAICLKKNHQGQTMSILDGVAAAKYPIIITMDSDLESDPEIIPEIVKGLKRVDVVVASRDRLPRFSERIVSIFYKRYLGIADILSNYRGFRKDTWVKANPELYQKFEMHFLLKAKLMGCRLFEVPHPTIRRRNSRHGTGILTEARIMMAFVGSVFYFLKERVRTGTKTI